MFQHHTGVVLVLGQLVALVLGQLVALVLVSHE